MWTWLRMAGGILFVIALFIRPLRWGGSNSAFQLAAHDGDFDSIALFVGAMAVGVTASISTFFTRRVVEWLEMTLAVLSVIGIVFFVYRFGVVQSHYGVGLTWAGVLLAGGLVMITMGALGRYRNTDH